MTLITTPLITDKPHIHIRGSTCTITNVDYQHLRELENLFSYKIQNAEETDAYQAGWDGIHYIFSNKRFPIGLLDPVCEYLTSKNISPFITDYRQLGRSFNIPINTSSSVVLRPYQEDIVSLAILKKASSIEVATGGGKTLIAGEMIRRLALRTLFITPARETLRQSADTLEEYLGFPVGRIGDGNYDIEHITVSTWQSLKDIDRSYLDSIDFLIVDEAQHLGAKILRRIAYDIPSIYRLGMSGTLFREDGADLEIIAATGPVIKKIGYAELIKAGYLVPAKVEVVRIAHPKRPLFEGYQDVYEDVVVSNEHRNREIIEKANSLVEQGRKVLIFVSRIEHGNRLAKYANNSGFLYSTHPDRDKILADFRSGKTRCLISTSVLDEGYDLPVIDAVILAAPSKSLIKTIQRIGRALRPYPGKTDALIIDVADDVKYLWAHFQRRLKRYQEEGLWSIGKIVPLKKDDDEWS
ncbi:MAG: DEAD/DEAH box helicase [Bacillati bacterium]